MGVLSYLALGGGHFCEQRLGNLGPLHLLLDLVINGGVDVDDAVLGLAVPLAWQSGRLHLEENKKVRNRGTTA